MQRVPPAHRDQGGYGSPWPPADVDGATRESPDRRECRDEDKPATGYGPEAGLRVVETGETTCPFVFPDPVVARERQAGPNQLAIAPRGEDAVRAAFAANRAHTRTDGSIRYENGSSADVERANGCGAQRVKRLVGEGRSAGANSEIWRQIVGCEWVRRSPCS